MFPNLFGINSNRKAESANLVKRGKIDRDIVFIYDANLGTPMTGLWVGGPKVRNIPPDPCIR